jgi:hypothetical protein
MTGLVVHQCPKCELRFSFRTELEHHLTVDHPAPATVRQAAVQVDEAQTPTAAGGASLPRAPASVPSAASDGFGGAGWGARLPALLLAVLSVLAVAYTALFVSISTAVIIAVLVLALAGIYVRRSRGRPRLPHR